MLFEITCANGKRQKIRLEGQRAKTLAALIRAGAAGITALECGGWAFRLADYVHRLRDLGVEIDTGKEAHDGGWHARYVLRTQAAIVEAA